jgi:hypothetical protein
MIEVIDLSTSYIVWTVLDSIFSHRLKTHKIHLKNDLRFLKRGTRNVTKYSRTFKVLCDQLATIDHHVNDTDIIYWYLHDFGPEFANLSTIQLSLSSIPLFHDLVPKAKSSEIFQKFLKALVASLTVFTDTKGTFNTFHNGGNKKSHGKGNFLMLVVARSVEIILLVAKSITMKDTLSSNVMIDMQGQLILMLTLLNLFLNVP